MDGFKGTELKKRQKNILKQRKKRVKEERKANRPQIETDRKKEIVNPTKLFLLLSLAILYYRQHFAYVTNTQT
jgi:hypothetical protein